MGAIARSAANNITTSGVFTSSAITNSSVTGITVLANASDGITFISSQTASNSASISFTSGLTSTYKAYKFVFSNMHPIVTEDLLMTNFSTDGGSNYNVTKTNTFFYAYHDEADTGTQFQYDTGADVAQSTDFFRLSRDTGAGNDESCSGSMILFNPSSTTYVKHFISNVNSYKDNDATIQSFVAGYGNTTSAINAIQFKFSYGNIDTGTIALYGIK